VGDAVAVVLVEMFQFGWYCHSFQNAAVSLGAAIAFVLNQLQQHVKPDVFVKYQDELVSHAVGAGLEQMRLQPPSLQPHFGMNDNTIQTETSQQEQQPQHHPQQTVNVVPQVMSGFTQQITHEQPVPTCGNVTPSPPQNSDY
jgi:hypothetical protein